MIEVSDKARAALKARPELSNAFEVRTENAGHDAHIDIADESVVDKVATVAGVDPMVARSVLSATSAVSWPKLRKAISDMTDSKTAKRLQAELESEGYLSQRTRDVLRPKSNGGS